MIKLIKGFFKIFSFNIIKIESNILKQLDQFADIENKEQRRDIMLRAYSLNYEFKTAERICDVAFRLRVDVDSLLIGLSRQKSELLYSCGLSKNDIIEAICNIDGINYYNESIVEIDQEDYAKAILDYLENKS